MKKLCKRLSLFLSLLMSFVSAVSFAQSSGDIELAKQLARQRGYSEGQINEMVSKLQGGSNLSSAVVSSSVDRNVSAAVDSKVAYGVAGSDGVVVIHSENSQRGEGSSIFGHYLFRTTNLNFIPSYNIPTPKNYKLSAGDELVIDLWGAVVKSISAEISPDGSLYIPDLGPLYVYGQTIEQVENNLKYQMSKIYSGLVGDDADTYMKVSLGKMKSVTVNVIGDVQKPGSYTLPSLSSIASVLYLAGGPNDLGSMRDIRLYRNNKLVSSLDVYDYLMNGNFDANIRLEDNDAILVVPFSNLVTLSGAVKRPMRYEVKDGETLSDLFSYCGGFTTNAYIGSVQVDRRKTDVLVDGPSSETFNVCSDEFETFKLKDGDVVAVRTLDGRFKNKVSVSGPVWRPGNYSLSDTLKTVRDLIISSGGLKEDAYLEKAYIVRYGKDRAKEQVSFCLKDVVLGMNDIELMPDDYIQIFNVNALKPDQRVSIRGEVNNPGEFEYRDGMTLGDIILMANGTTNAATLEKVEIARRIKSDEEPEVVKNIHDTIAVLLSYNLLKNPMDVDVKLEPFDVIFIRRSVYYKPQEKITITGEVNYPGSYVVEKNTVRLSDIVKRAEGFNRDAYVKGAKLTRILTKEELERLHLAMSIARTQADDSTIFDVTGIGDRFSIAIDLEKAVANPGSDADIVLRENDIIHVPKYNNTVKVSGGVLLPNTISYSRNRGYKQYIYGAGGFLKEAMKGKVYMVHMNGSVATKGSKDFEVMPGTEIVVPMRKKKNPQSVAAILAAATSATSLAAMVATIVSITSK